MAEVWDVRQLKLTWETCRNAPCSMRRVPAVVYGNVCYFSSQYSYDVFAYDSEKDDWSKLPECPQFNFGLAVINNLLTAVGGLFSDDVTNRLVSFNGSKWVTIFPPMPTKRWWPTVISAQNYLIAAGGVGVGRRVLSTVEVMNIATREWYTAASLPETVFLISATVCGGCLYLLGGQDKNYVPTHAVFTCTLDSLLHSCHPPPLTPPHTNEAGVWQRIADAPMKYSTCTTLNGRVLAVGGDDSHYTPTADVYMYNADSDSWPLVGHMSRARSQCLVVELRDCIIAVGGYDVTFTTTSSVEVGYLQLSGQRVTSTLPLFTSILRDPGYKQHDDLIHEFEILTTDQDGLLGVLEDTLHDEHGDEANFEAKKLLCALFQKSYDNCKEAVIRHISMQLYKRSKTSADIKKKLHTLFEVQSKKTQELEDTSQVYGQHLHTCGLRTDEMGALYSANIKAKMYSEISSHKVRKKVKETLESNRKDYLGKAIELTWKFVTLSKPLIVCQPKKYDRQIHDPEHGHWDSKRSNHLIYTRPVVYRNYKGALACQGWVATTRADNRKSKWNECYPS